MVTSQRSASSDAAVWAVPIHCPLYIGAFAMKIANRDARQYVQRLHPFEGSNLFAQFRPEGDGLRYIVYSYGHHWPLFVHVNGTWFENVGKNSRTTAKHRTQTHPHQPTLMLSPDRMLQLASGGYQAIAKERVLGAVPQQPRQQRDPVWLSAHGM